MHTANKVAILILAGAWCAAAGYGQGRPAPSSSGGNSSSASAGSLGRNTSPLSPENSLEVIKPPAAPGEDKAYKAFKKFQGMPNDDLVKKTEAGEDFLKKYPTGTYSGYVYSFLTVAYIQLGQVDKGVNAGEKGLQLNPNDVRTMGVLSQTLARTANDTSAESQARLAKAETYGKQAVAQAPTLPKPEGMSDANFDEGKKQTLAMAHAGLGLVALRKNDFEGAIPDLEQAVQLGTNEDPTNYYLLGMANLNAGHNDKAATAFEKCAAMKDKLQPTCTELAQKAKAAGAAK